MIQSEHILEYIDGQLDTESEQELFDALAGRPDLRSALRQFISIGQAVHADREAYTPPADVERDLFAGLGFTAADLGFTTSSMGIMARLGAVIAGRFWGAVDAFVLGVLLAGLLFHLLGVDPHQAGAMVAGRMPAGNGAAGNDTSGHVAGALIDNGGTGNTAAGAPSGAAASDNHMNSGAGATGTDGGSGANLAPASGQEGTGSDGAAANRNTASARAQSSRTRSQLGGMPIGADGTTRHVTETDGHNNAMPREARSRFERAASRRTNAASVIPADGSTTQRDARAVDRNANNGASLDAGRDGGRALTTTDRRNGQATSSEANTTVRDANGSSAVRDRAASTSDRSGTATAPAVNTTPDAVLVLNSSQFDVVQPRRNTPAIATTVAPVPAEVVLSSTLRERVGGANPLDMETSVATEGGGMLAEVRGQLGWALNTSNVHADVASGRQAYAVGALWRFADGLGLGLEAGSETYDQTLRYQGGDTLQIDQRPRYTWGGATLRYEISRFSLVGLAPFVQTTLGATSVGPMLRVRVGAQYQISGAFGATIGGEMSSLMYQFDGQRLMSGRVGATAGLQYIFR